MPADEASPQRFPNQADDCERSADAATHTVAFECDEDISTFLRAINLFSVAQMRCVSVRYEVRPKGCVCVVEVSTQRQDRLETVVRRIAAMVGVSGCYRIGWRGASES